MPTGMEPTKMTVVLPLEEGRDSDDRVGMVVEDREVVEIDDDTPPRTNVVERVEVEGGGGGCPGGGATGDTGLGAAVNAREGTRKDTGRGAGGDTGRHTVGEAGRRGGGGQRAPW